MELMASNKYHFEDHWEVPFPIENVWEVLSRPREFPVWWQGVYLSAEPLDHSSTEPRVGARVAAVARGWLPYKLHFTIETIELQKPTLIVFKASGDFETDGSRWILARNNNGGTHVVLDWNPIVEKPIVKLLSPILKPIFRWNHNWTMIRGQRQIVDYMAKTATVAHK
jgi:Activator of Hsp90 ATPase homolog 1-like protein